MLELEKSSFVAFPILNIKRNEKYKKIYDFTYQDDTVEILVEDSTIISYDYAAEQDQFIMTEEINRQDLNITSMWRLPYIEGRIVLSSTKGLISLDDWKDAAEDVLFKIYMADQIKSQSDRFALRTKTSNSTLSTYYILVEPWKLKALDLTITTDEKRSAFKIVLTENEYSSVYVHDTYAIFFSPLNQGASMTQALSYFDSYGLLQTDLEDLALDMKVQMAWGDGNKIILYQIDGDYYWQRKVALIDGFKLVLKPFINQFQFIHTRNHFSFKIFNRDAFYGEDNLKITWHVEISTTAYGLYAAIIVVALFFIGLNLMSCYLSIKRKVYSM